ncbi:MAG TPA: hypothetical protein ACFYD6_02495 [Candidatus Brocadiia bacterium]|nr:hypothetical protein [Planctomycetota bacterium]MBI4007083.1 hypothetical protein [Planctomycetota bacterium]MDO8092940.1 hypothetical protein [Candidatus Brocadiales bacterium]
MKFVLFLILPILLIGCTATSTEHIGQNLQTSEVQPPSQQLSKQHEPEETKTSSGIEHQRILDGRMEHSRSEEKTSSGREVETQFSSGEKELKLAEPAPETLRRSWGGIWHVPAGITPPKSNINTENNGAPQKSSATLPKIEEAASASGEHVESEKGKSLEPPETDASNSPELTDRVDASPSPKRQPWSGIWYAPLKKSSPSVGEELLSQNVETPPPASWDDYKEVDFGKFASGSYGADYANKYVKIKCRFSRLGSEFVEFPKYPRTEYVTCIVTGVSSQLRSLSVVMSRSQADVVFKLKPQEEIDLYGKAVQIDLHTLTMEVRKIER